MGLFDSLLRRTVREGVREGVNQIAKQAASSAGTKQYRYTFQSIPKTVEEMKALPEADLKDPGAVAALIVMALDRYGTDRQASVDMMNFLKGPEPLSEMERQQINNQFMDGRDYTARSYMKGAVPSNNYTPAQPIVIEPFENPYSRENFNQGYIKIFINSGGADSPRQIRLRRKPSTGTNRRRDSGLRISSSDCFPA